MSESITYIGPDRPFLTRGAEYEVEWVEGGYVAILDDFGNEYGFTSDEYKKHENPATEGGVVLDTPEGRVVGESVWDCAELHALACEQDGQNRGDG